MKTSSTGSEAAPRSVGGTVLRSAGPLFAGALGFVAVFLARLWTVDDYWWAARDDAVITLSHAKNAADFGTIGVSPGDRVEGFSSPLQFAAAYLVESVGSPTYRSLASILLVAALVIGGLALATGCRWLGSSVGLEGRGLAWFVAVLPILAAGVVATSWTTVGWLGSGMENPWLVASGLAIVAASLAPTPGRVAVALAVGGLSALSIGRVEFAAFTPPVILATAWVLARREPSERRRLVAGLVVALPLVCSLVVHLARRTYFGEWLPNTAVVQGRSSGADQIIALAIVVMIGVAIVVDAAVGDVPLAARDRALARAATRSVIGVLGAVLVWWSASGRTAAPLQDLVLFPPLLPLLVSIGVLLQLARALGVGGWPPNAVFACLVSVPLAQQVVMGPARLDGYRVVSIVVPFAVVWVAALSARIWFARVEAPGGRRIPRVALALVAGLFVVGTAWGARNDAPRYLNYAISGTDRIIAATDAVRADELDGVGLPLLANPDLGKVSFAKRAIITDLGLLGDPVLTLVVTERNDLTPRFLSDVVHPDVVEVHGGFSCAYGPWLASPVFGEAHTSTDESWQGALDEDGCFLGGRSAIWLRTDAAGERALSRALIDADAAAPLVAAALSDCVDASDEPFRCEGVRRSVQRVAEVLRDRGEFDAVVAEFRASPSAELATAMLRRGPGWGDDAYEAFVAAADVTRP